MTEPLWTVHDAVLGVTIGEPRSRAEAEADATGTTIEAGRNGQCVAQPDGRDRFLVRRVPPARAPESAYTTLQVEAALCLYEAMIDARMDSTSPAFEDAGSLTMRHHAIALAPYALAVFELIPEETRFGHAYDFGIIPAILNTVIWNHAGYLLPDVETARDAVVEALAAEVD